MQFLASILLALPLLGGVARAENCVISAIDEAKLLALPYAEFDQSMGQGWRVYGDRKCHLLSAELLDRYVALHKGTLLAWQMRVVTWHSGQMYAFHRDYDLARARFQLAFDPTETADTSLLWNDYVSATLAFLDRDIVRLRKHRDRIMNGPMIDGVPGNLDVVNGLLGCLDKPYATAYSDPACKTACARFLTF